MPGGRAIWPPDFAPRVGIVVTFDPHLWSNPPSHTHTHTGRIRLIMNRLINGSTDQRDPVEPALINEWHTAWVRAVSAFPWQQKMATNSNQTTAPAGAGAWSKYWPSMHQVSLPSCVECELFIVHLAPGYIYIFTAQKGSHLLHSPLALELLFFNSLVVT